jgi:hypothetical protein
MTRLPRGNGIPGNLRASSFFAPTLELRQKGPQPSPDAGDPKGPLS